MNTDHETGSVMTGERFVSVDFFLNFHLFVSDIECSPLSIVSFNTHVVTIRSCINESAKFQSDFFSTNIFDLFTLISERKVEGTRYYYSINAH